MPANSNPQARTSSAPWGVWLALVLVYVVWGTTYFALGIALQSMPPLLMNALRFLCAGGVMLFVALWQGQALPTVAQWRNAAVVGGCMVFLAMNCIGFAQKLGIGSGLMATVVTTMPMWLALRPPRSATLIRTDQEGPKALFRGISGKISRSSRSPARGVTLHVPCLCRSNHSGRYRTTLVPRPWVGSK